MATERNSNQCTTVVYYGLTNSEGASRDFCKRIIEWFQTLGRVPNQFAVSGPNFRGKLIRFDRAMSRLDRQGYDDVTGVTILSSQPDVSMPLNEYQCVATWSKENDYVIVSALSSLVSFSTPSLMTISRLLVEQFAPAYGVGFLRAQNLGPCFYAIGINFGTPVTADLIEEDKRTAVTRWMDAAEGKLWYKGILRDVYPWNFLGPEQLQRTIGGQTLEAWIKQDKNRGFLEPFGSLTLWKIEDSFVPVIQRELARADLIFDWRRDLPDFAEPAGPVDIEKFFGK